MSARSLACRAAFAFAVLACAVLAPACSEKTTLVAPHVNDPPESVTLFPAPRSTGVYYDTAIWAQFDRALDPATVDTMTVYLKLDTRRTPIQVTYLPTVHRIQLQPRAQLELGRTYTVEVSGRVKTPAGDSLGTPLRWQFTTNTLRRIVYVGPAPDALEGPHVLLQWGGNGGPSNNILYEVYAGSDSDAVANHTIAPLQNQVFVNYLPRIAWESGRRTYWSVTATNLASGERLSGGVSSFDVYPADAPVDSMVFSLYEFGGAGSNNRTQFCTSTTIQTGPAFNSGVRWNFNGDRPWLRVADARFTMYASSTSSAVVGSANTQAWYATNAFTACNFNLNSTPYTEVNGRLSTATVNGLRADFREPGFAAFVEAASRWGSWYGVLLRGSANVTWDMATNGVPAPSLTVWYYRTPSTPRAPAPGASASR